MRCFKERTLPLTEFSFRVLSSFAYITCRKPYVDAGGGVAGLKKGGSVLSAKVAALILSKTGRHRPSMLFLKSRQLQEAPLHRP